MSKKKLAIHETNICERSLQLNFMLLALAEKESYLKEL